MTKHILRLVVTILILTAVGLCLWFFVFKPTDAETTFDLLTELDEFKTSSSYESTLRTIRDFDNEELWTEEALADRYRIFGAPEETEIVVSSEPLLKKKSFYIMNNYRAVEDSLTEVYNTYISYSLFAEDVSKKEMKDIKAKINDYKTSLTSVVNSANSLIEYENQCKTTDNVEALKPELARRYEQFAGSYKSAFSNYLILIQSLKDLVKERTFGGDFVYNSQTCFLDLILLLDSEFLGTTSDASSAIVNAVENKETLTSEQVALKKACTAYDSYLKVTGWFDAFGSSDIGNFLTAYLNLTQNYNEDLALATSKSFNYFAIDQLCTNTTGGGTVSGYAPSNIDDDAKADLITVLKFSKLYVEGE